VLLDKVDRAAVHVLKRREHLAETVARECEQAQHVVEGADGKERDIDRLGEWRRDERDLGDNAERALGANEELLEVVASVVFADSAEEIEDVAIGEHDLEARHGAVERAVAQKADAARIGADVATDLTAALGAEVERNGATERSEVLFELLENDAGLGGDNGGGVVKVEARFMRDKERTISSCTGTLPPTRPVLPPCGTTASECAAQCFITAATCAVVRGRTTTTLFASLAVYFLIQSVVYAVVSSGAVSTPPLSLTTFFNVAMSSDEIRANRLCRAGLLAKHRAATRTEEPLIAQECLRRRQPSESRPLAVVVE
jgi:hypothetical protein